MLNQDICYLYDSIAVYSSYGGIVFAEEEGRNIAKALGPKNKVPTPFLSILHFREFTDWPAQVAILLNQYVQCFVLVALQRLLMTLTVTFEQNIALIKASGLLSTGSTVDEAGFLFGLLDRGCAIQIQYVKYICL